MDLVTCNEWGLFVCMLHRIEVRSACARRLVKLVNDSERKERFSIYSVDAVAEKQMAAQDDTVRVSNI